ncbi:MAG: SDR family oxidoreductase [Proteobacteria bacterium]|nr:SDR family oxidoreductase [Pseudomonadota bacterium]
MTGADSTDLTGRVAVVTGAGRNIGRAIALTLAAAGAAVVVNARQSRDEIEAVAAEIAGMSGRALPILADITDPAAVARMAQAAQAKFGRVDILVNNAAVRHEAKLDAIELAEWRRIIAIILDGAFICVKAFLPLLREAGRDSGAIVNIGGITADIGSANRPHIVAAKAGLVGLTRALAHDLAPDGVTVNCVVPGLIETARKATSSVEPSHRALRNTLLGRLGTPADVAAAVRYLAGPGARYVTGQTLHVNGGTFLG